MEYRTISNYDRVIQGLNLDEKCSRAQVRVIFTLSIVCHQPAGPERCFHSFARRVTFRKRRLINKATSELNNNVSRACETGDALGDLQ